MSDGKITLNANGLLEREVKTDNLPYVSDLKPYFTDRLPGFVGFVIHHREEYIREQVVELAGGADYIRSEMRKGRELGEITKEANDKWWQETKHSFDTPDKTNEESA
jgi:hypothetical protein